MDERSGLTEEERAGICHSIADKMRRAGLGDDWYDALMRMAIPDLIAAAYGSQFLPERMPERTPYERGVLDRYQDRRDET
jgi:hypothetical protein